MVNYDKLDDFEWLFLDYCKNGNFEGIKKIIPHIYTHNIKKIGFMFAWLFRNS
jgi:hypothetical protein